MHNSSTVTSPSHCCAALSMLASLLIVMRGYTVTLDSSSTAGRPSFAQRARAFAASFSFAMASASSLQMSVANFPSWSTCTCLRAPGTFAFLSSSS